MRQWQLKLNADERHFLYTLVGIANSDHPEMLAQKVADISADFMQAIEIKLESAEEVSDG